MTALSSCDIRYGIVPLNRIFNWLEFRNHTSWCYWSHKGLQSHWWNDDVVEYRDFAHRTFLERFDRLTGYYTSMKSSIEEKGIIDPIRVATGIPTTLSMEEPFSIKTLPPHMQTNPSQYVYTHIFGGSRVMIAQELGIEEIPCIIYDNVKDGTWDFCSEKLGPSNLKKEIESKFPSGNYFYSIGDRHVRVKTIRYSDRNVVKNKNAEKQLRLKEIDKLKFELSETETYRKYLS